MSLTILFLPLISAACAGLFGRSIGSRGASWLTTTSIIFTSILSWTLFYQVAFGGQPVWLPLLKWMDSEYLDLQFGLCIDSLTCSMLILVTSVSALVHMYSTGYMSEDPHLPRFMSYLSLFTFFMIVLVTADNLVQLFIGWEGEVTPQKIYFLIIIAIGLIPRRTFFSLGKGISSLQRIGPHNNEFLSFIIGSMLGDCHLEKRKGGLGTRIIFEQCQQNVEYLNWYHQFLVDRGYCSRKKPYLRKRIGKDNQVFFSYRIHSYTFTSWNWLHTVFYWNNIKQIPRNPEIWDLFTPFSLAIWYMDDGSRTPSGARLHTQNFNLSDIQYLCRMLELKFQLQTSIQSSGPNKGFFIYIKAQSWIHFRDLIEPHMHPSMKYKLEKKINPKPQFN